MTGRRIAGLVAFMVCCYALQGVAAAADDAAAPPKPTETIAVGAGVEMLSLHGNDRRFEQYVTPPSGLYLSEAEWQRHDVTGGASFGLTLQDIGAPGPSGEVWFAGTGVSLDGQYRRSEFFSDFTPASGSSRRYDYAAALTRLPAPNRRLSVELSTREVALEGNPASGRVDWRDHRDGVGLGLNTGDYWVGVHYNREAFDTEAARLFSGTTQTYGVSLAPRLAARTQVSGHSTWNVTSLDGFAGEVRTWDSAARLLYPLSDQITVTGEVRHHAVDETIIRNAYAKRQTSGTLEAEYRPRPGTTVVATWRTALTDYVDGLQLNTLGVPSDLLQIRVRSRVLTNVKFDGRYARYDVRDRPLYYHVDQTLGNSLIYSDLTRWDLSATYTPTSRFGLTGQWQRRSWENDAQGVDSFVETTALTGWWNPGDKVALTASLVHQGFSLPVQDITTLSGYASRANSGVLSATYSMSEASTLYATYARALASGATDSENWRLLLGCTHSATPHDRLLMEVSLGDFGQDANPELGIRADLARFEWRHEL